MIWSDVIADPRRQPFDPGETGSDRPVRGTGPVVRSEDVPRASGGSEPTGAPSLEDDTKIIRSLAADSGIREKRMRMNAENADLLNQSPLRPFEMNEKIYDLLHQPSFHPFEIVMANGNRHLIRHADMAFAPIGSPYGVIFTDDHRMVSISYEHVAEIIYPVNA